MEAITPSNIMDAENSDTPIVDKIPRRAPFNYYFAEDVLVVARQLERELNELRRQNERLREALKETKKVLLRHDKCWWNFNSTSAMIDQAIESENKPESGKGE